MVSLIIFTTLMSFFRATFLHFDLVITVEMVSCSEAEELDELEPIFLAMYDLLTFPFEDVLPLEEVDTMPFQCKLK